VAGTPRGFINPAWLVVWSGIVTCGIYGVVKSSSGAVVNWAANSSASSHVNSMDVDVI